MAWDDPQIHTVKEFLTDERDALIEHLDKLNHENEIDNSEEIIKILHVIQYLKERLEGKYVE
tara:strand:+ start:646 stop:831 length:186 start_codon:yes stop_codon:yes gene_type:complete